MNNTERHGKGSSWKKVSLSLLIVFFWMAMIGFLLEKEGFIGEEPPRAHFREFMPDHIEFDTWKGIYVKGKWVGYVHTILAPAVKGHTISSLSYLRFRMLNQFKDLVITSLQTLDDDYRLTAFETHISGLAGISLKGKRIGNQIVTDISYNNRSYSKTFDIADDLFLDQSLLQLYRGSNLKVGDSYALSILNPLTLTTERIESTVVGTEGDSLIMETNFAGLVSKTWIDPDGVVIREETPNGWVIKIEEKKEIEGHLVRLDGGSVDILREVSVKPAQEIANPRAVSALTLRVSGVSITDFDMDGERQKLVDPDRGMVEITTVHPGSNTPDITSLRAPELSVFLKPTPWIDSDDPAILSAARDIVGNETNSWIAAAAIGRWVHHHLKKTFIPEIPVASVILEKKTGDCNEHTALFIALARAAGIPSEMCAGLVYMNDGFYYHAWPKVFVGRWVHLDPTLDQAVADATHFELVSGDFSAQSKIALTIGTIKIDVLNVTAGGHNGSGPCNFRGTGVAMPAFQSPASPQGVSN